jgi:hypothetical protein
VNSPSGGPVGVHLFRRIPEYIYGSDQLAQLTRGIVNIGIISWQQRQPARSWVIYLTYNAVNIPSVSQCERSFSSTDNINASVTRSSFWDRYLRVCIVVQSLSSKFKPENDACRVGHKVISALNNITTCYTRQPGKNIKKIVQSRNYVYYYDKIFCKVINDIMHDAVNKVNDDAHY